MTSTLRVQWKQTSCEATPRVSIIPSSYSTALSSGYLWWFSVNWFLFIKCNKIVFYPILICTQPFLFKPCVLLCSSTGSVQEPVTFKHWLCSNIGCVQVLVAFKYCVQALVVFTFYYFKCVQALVEFTQYNSLQALFVLIHRLCPSSGCFQALVLFKHCVVCAQTLVVSKLYCIQALVVLKYYLCSSISCVQTLVVFIY